MEKKYIEKPIYIDELDLPTQVINALLKAGLTTIQDLEREYRNNNEFIIEIRGLGAKSRNLIKDEYFKIFKYKLGQKPFNFGDVRIKQSQETLRIHSYPGQFPHKTIKETITKRYIIAHHVADLFESNLNNNIYFKCILSEELFLNELPLSWRIINSLNKHGIYKVKDVCSMPIRKLLKIRGIGKISLVELSELLSDTKNTNSFQRKENLNFIDTLLNKINNIEDKIILCKRYGLFSGESMTLDGIGKEYNLTRERIRQRLSRTINNLKLHPYTCKKDFINILDKLILRRDGIFTDGEADLELVKFFKSSKYDGSAILDFLVELNSVSKMEIGNIRFYYPIYDTDLKKIIYRILKFLKKQTKPLTVKEIIHTKDLIFIPDTFNCSAGSIKTEILLTKILRLIPQCDEQRPNVFMVFKHSNKTKIWINTIEIILEKQGIPMHFSQITKAVNQYFINKHVLDERRVHSLLVDEDIFAHTGTRGMYGLASWGIRKESTSELIKECILNTGYRTHWKQIYEYVSRFKRTSKTNIKSLLDNNGQFIPIGNGTYDIKE
jgi:hypothetical protein